MSSPHPPHRRPALALLGLLLSGAPAAYAQQPAPAAPDTLVTGRFVEAGFEQLARSVESQTPYRFYFDPASVETLCVNVAAERQPLPVLLDAVLIRAGLHYAIDRQRRVFVTAGQPIRLGLPPGFFRDTTAAPSLSEDDDPLAGLNRARPVRRATDRVYDIGLGQPRPASGKATLAGHLRDARSGEPVVGATVYTEQPSAGTATDEFGYYALTLPLGRHTVLVRGIGLKDSRRTVVLHADGKLEIETEEDVTALREVVIEAEKDKNVSGLQMGLERLDIKTIRQVPTAFGEADLLRVVLTLPGVKSVGESSTGLNVRGGAVDQNLILFNDAVVYNPAHLFGFFSAFNPDMLKSVELYKSAIPAKYGGRLSSVLDIVTREGNNKKFGASGGIGPLTGRLTVEGPILKDRASFIISGRSSYSDWLLRRLPVKSFRESSASFNDLSAHLSWELDAKNSVYATGYLSQDQFRLASDTTFRYQNRTASLKWKHIFTNKLYAVATANYSGYQYRIRSEQNAVNASELGYQLAQGGGQLDFSYFLSQRHTLEFGASSTRYRVQPGSLQPRGTESLIRPEVLAREQGQESALYVSDRLELGPRLSVAVGLRYSLYQALGPQAVRRYLAGVPRSEATVLDTVQYGRGRVLATYHGPEYRLSARYALTTGSSLKASYNRTRQYISLLTNTAAVSPTDVWKLSDAHLRPQLGDQVALGYYHNFQRNTVETSVEVYYKWLRDVLDYKSGASLLLNRNLETDVVNAQGRAYGVELLVKKLTGKLNGWLSYSYSRALLRVPPAVATDMVNGGRWYPSNFDKPHDATLAGNYRVNRRFSASLNVTYSTGRPITLPLAQYYLGNSLRVYYSDRNAYRVPDYFRADVGLNIEGNHKVRKLAHGYWTLGVYNLTGRRNPYSVYFKAENGRINGYQLSIFARPIPNLTYNFKF
ncbi:TonB-dependent receptor [Hymenobacter gummosus]|uniref:TonB-dependent receptor n=1 Tax=Hymenobacter gummosus TaxID=1776032 RepID=A0A3S0JE89_9BACT|nr:TonB-dependent receptor [Hymenobacter gummosus]RTQ46579.1 TonB-dependent receptor [Hymenobacter gummosus]